MHRKQNNEYSDQSGFSPLFIILSIVAVLAIGSAFWYVWQKNRQDSHPDNTAQTNAEDNQQSTNDSGLDDSKYLVIKEWGVRIPLSDDISGAYYVFDEQDLAEYAQLYDSGFDELENSNGISCAQGIKYQIYSISRTKPENVAQLEEFAGPEYKHFPFTDDYVYGGLGAHQASPPCASLSDPNETYEEDENIIKVVSEKEQAFDQAFNELQQQ